MADTPSQGAYAMHTAPFLYTVIPGSHHIRICIAIDIIRENKDMLAFRSTPQCRA